MPRRSGSTEPTDKIVRLPGRGRPRAADRAPVGIQAVDVALEILEDIAENGSAMSLTALSRKTNILPSKLHRYLVSLTRRGLLAQAPITGLYDLGPAARRIGMAALNRFDEMGHAHQAVTTLSARTGYAIGLYVWTDLGPALVRLEMGAHAFPVALRVGSALPLCTSANGRVFLAYMPDSVTAPLVARERAAAAAEGQPIPDGRALSRELKKIKEQKIYWTHDAIIPSLVIVAPVFDAHGRLFCTLTALAPRGHGDERRREHLIHELRASVDELARDLFGTKPADDAVEAAPVKLKAAPRGRTGDAP
jgi:DNA-binding IclR family transcriptional regulator